VRESIDLDRLSAAERTALELLAQGHTAKSIAGLMGQTEGSINERLRSARRKTGVGSSRELARLVGAQKNRAENFGMSSGSSSVAVDGGQAPPKRARLASSKGSLLMLVTLCAAAAALVLQGPSMIPQTAPTGPVKDSLLGSTFFEPQAPPNFNALHDQVRRETRAQAWADQSEAALRDTFDRALRAGGKSELRVICGSTLCEAAGLVSGDHAHINVAMVAIQDRRTIEDTKKAGLQLAGMRFGQAPPSRRNTVAFLTYWKRQND
jgi:DNA-binding CsgD family transcriptional regulator